MAKKSHAPSGSVTERLVRFQPSFFADLDNVLPSERSPFGAPSATDFLLYDLPPVRDVLASDFERRTVPVASGDRLRMFVGSGTLVRTLVVYAYLADDDHVDAVGLELEIFDESPDG